MEVTRCASILNNLAMAEEGTGNVQKAETRLQQVISMSASRSDARVPYAAALNNLARLYTRQKRFKEASALYQQALSAWSFADAKNHPDYASTLNNLGALYTNGGQTEPAGAAFRKAIAADPTHADAQYQLGVYLLSKAQTKADGTVIPVEGTQAAFEKYLELKPTGAFADSAKGMIQMMGATLATGYQNPDAKKNTPGAKPPAAKKK